MKKKAYLIVMIIILFACFFLSGCNTVFGEKHITDCKKYGKWESYLDVPTFLPNEINQYKVNSYSYRLLAYLDICYEIFLDISVTEEQFDKLIESALNYSKESYKKDAYYANGYQEIVIKDYYDIYYFENENNVGWADIEKVIYNVDTLNIIYVCFHANDTGVYDLDEVAYFNRFSINEKEYVENLV